MRSSPRNQYTDQEKICADRSCGVEGISRSAKMSTPVQEKDWATSQPQAEADGNESSLANILAHALALAQHQSQVRPGQMTSDVVNQVINLLKLPKSKQRDAEIRVVMNTITKCLGTGKDPDPESQDARLLAAIGRLQSLLEVDCE